MMRTLVVLANCLALSLGSMACSKSNNCKANKKSDGTVVISCPGQKDVSITPAANGTNGTNGTNGDLGSKGDTGDVGQPGLDGDDALPCTVVDNQDGTSTVSCPDGTDETWWTGFTGRIFYMADPENDTTKQLYMTQIDGGIPTVFRLNDDLTTGGTVDYFLASANGQKVIYTANQDTVGTKELYLVDLSGLVPSAPVKVNGTLVTNGDVVDFRMNTAGTKVVYRANQDDENKYELYFVDISQAIPAASIKISPTLVSGGTVWDAFFLAENGSGVVFQAEADVDNKVEVYWVNLTNPTPAAAVKINDPLPSDSADIDYSSLSGDGSTIVFRGDQDTLDDVRMYFVDVSTGTPTSPQDISGQLVASGAFIIQMLSYDGSKILYVADQDTNDVFNLYYIDMSDVSPSPVVLNNALAGGESIGMLFKLAPGGEGVLYDVRSGGYGIGVYYVDLSGASPVAPEKLNSTLKVGGSSTMALSADASTALYVAAQDVDNVYDLYLVSLVDGVPASRTKLNYPLPVGGIISFMVVSDDGKNIVYRGNLSSSNTSELNLVSMMPNGQPSAPFKVNLPIIDTTYDGIAITFAIR